MRKGSSNAGSGFVKLGRPGRIIEHALGPGQTIMLAQHCPTVFGPEQPAPLQDRDYLGGEGVKLRGSSGGMMLNPSAAPSVNQSSIRPAICSGVPAVTKCPRAPAR